MITLAEPLPDDLDTAHQLIRELLKTPAQQVHLNEKLQHQLEQLLRQRYGPKTERIDPDQLLLFAREILAQAEPAPTPEPTPEPTPRAPKKEGHGRKPLPASLPRKPVLHDVPPEQRTCPDCGVERTCIGQEVREQLEFIPASLVVLEHIRPKYACRACEANVVIAERLPEPIEKGLPGPGCWPTSRSANMAIICRSIASRGSSGGTTSSCRGRRCATGWPPSPSCWSRSSSGCCA
jgi:transposase